MSRTSTDTVSTRLKPLAGLLAVLASSALVVGCATASTDAPAPTTAGGTSTDSQDVDCVANGISVQNWNVGEAGADDPMLAVAALYEETTGNTVTVNTVNVEVFRSQLPTYITSNNPPDVLKWLAGSTTSGFAEAGQLLDISDVWAESLGDIPDGLKALSTDSRGNQYFVPTNYYWWAIFYRPSLFADNGYSVPETWDEFIALAEQMDADGLIPVGIGTSGAEWVATAWFDYLNLRINGPDFHRALLRGEHDWNGPEVQAVFEKFAEIQPYIDPNSSGQEWQAGLEKFFNKEAGMTLIGGFLPIPESVGDDLDFFSFPAIDPSIPRVEEAPTDGFFSPATTANPECAKQFLAFLGTNEAQALLRQGANIATNLTFPDSEYSDLVKKGRDLLAAAADITQFYDRDSSQALGNLANAANARFIAQGPRVLDEILNEWDSSSKRVIEEQGLN